MGVFLSGLWGASEVNIPYREPRKKIYRKKELDSIGGLYCLVYNLSAFFSFLFGCKREIELVIFQSPNRLLIKIYKSHLPWQKNVKRPVESERCFRSSLCVIPSRFESFRGSDKKVQGISPMKFLLIETGFLSFFLVHTQILYTGK